MCFRDDLQDQNIVIIALNKRRYQSNIFFLFMHETTCCGYSLEAAQGGAFIEHHNICFCAGMRYISLLCG